MSSLFPRPRETNDCLKPVDWFKTKPTRKLCQKKNFEILSKYRLLAVVDMVKATHIKRQRKRCSFSKVKTVSVWLAKTLNQSISKSQKNRFQFYASFCVVYSLQRYRRIAVYKESQKKRQKRKTEKHVSRLFNNDTMTERNMERYKESSKDFEESGTVAKIPQGVKWEFCIAAKIW